MCSKYVQIDVTPPCIWQNLVVFQTPLEMAAFGYAFIALCNFENNIITFHVFKAVVDRMVAFFWVAVSCSVYERRPAAAFTHKDAEVTQRRKCVRCRGRLEGVRREDEIGFPRLVRANTTAAVCGNLNPHWLSTNPVPSTRLP
jgi:hypothetical protein